MNADQLVLPEPGWLAQGPLGTEAERTTSVGLAAARVDDPQPRP